MSSKIKADLEKFLIVLRNEGTYSGLDAKYNMISVDYIAEKIEAILDGVVVFHPKINEAFNDKI